jgi:hypothetical protein
MGKSISNLNPALNKNTNSKQQNNEINNKNSNKIEDLKLKLKFPNYYLSDYLFNLKNEIDLSFSKKQLNEIQNGNETNLNRINKQWIELINEIESFEDECVKKNQRKTRTTDLLFKTKTYQEITSIQNQQQYEKINYKIEKFIFSNKTISYMEGFEVFNNEKPFIFRINDEYFDLKLLKLIHHNTSFCNNNNNISNETIKLQILHKKLLDICNNHSINVFNLDVYLINELNLSRKNIHKIDQDTFNGFVNLLKLNLEINNLSRLDENILSSELLNLKELNLKNNKLNCIDSRLFLNLKKLEILYLKSNLINRIEMNSFVTLSRLLNLDLSFNCLKCIKCNLFQGLDHLEVLDLSNNDISEIEENSFQELSNYLVRLYLNNNKLKKINSNDFKKLENLEVLDLALNKIDLIELNAFQGFANLAKLNYFNY